VKISGATFSSTSTRAWPGVRVYPGDGARFPLSAFSWPGKYGRWRTSCPRHGVADGVIQRSSLRGARAGGAPRRSITTGSICARARTPGERAGARRLGAHGGNQSAARGLSVFPASAAKMMRRLKMKRRHHTTRVEPAEIRITTTTPSGYARAMWRADAAGAQVGRGGKIAIPPRSWRPLPQEIGTYYGALHRFGAALSCPATEGRFKGAGAERSGNPVSSRLSAAEEGMTASSARSDASDTNAMSINGIRSLDPSRFSPAERRRGPSTETRTRINGCNV